MVPNGWDEVKLGDVITHQKGFAFKSENYTTSGLRIIRISDTDRNSVHDKAPVYISNVNSVGLERYKLLDGDIILSTVGSRPHLLDSMVGKAIQIPKKDEGSLLNQNLVKISPKESFITNEYLYSMLKKSRFNYFISTLVRGNANQVSITLTELFSYKFLLPSYPEQRKIAKILSTWDKAIAATEKLIETSKQQKKALMQQLLTGKKRLVNPETGKVFEGTWEEVKLGDVAAMNSGGTPKSSVSEYYDGKHPWVSIADMTKHGKWISKTEKSLTDEGIANSSARLYPKGTVLYAMYASIGECSIATVELCSSQAILGIRPNSNLINIYLYYYLINLKEKIILTGQQGTQSNLNAGMVKGFTIKLPTIVEQQKIASVLTAADKEIEVLEAKLAHFKQEKKALMQQLLTGKRRVKVDEAEAA